MPPQDERQTPPKVTAIFSFLVGENIQEEDEGPL